jgi:hypothetical protein
MNIPVLLTTKNSCFENYATSISKLLANDGQQVNVGQTARLPMLRAFWKIELKETGCRLLLSRI